MHARMWLRLGWKNDRSRFPGKKEGQTEEEAWKVLEGRETCAERRGDCCLGRGWFKEREQAIEDGRSID